MSVESALAEGRVAALLRMTSTATIYRAGALSAPDPDTGIQSTTYLTIHPATPFRLGGAERGSSGARTQDFGGVEVTLATRVGSLGVAASGIQDGDLIDVLAGENAGTVWRIVEADWADQQTARRVQIIAAERPEGGF